ncbi:MAG: hypothetical protein ACI9KE_001480 [Polyangiales bacterium]|jgi:hypothetical protein
MWRRALDDGRVTGEPAAKNVETFEGVDEGETFAFGVAVAWDLFVGDEGRFTERRHPVFFDFAVDIVSVFEDVLLSLSKALGFFWSVAERKLHVEVKTDRSAESEFGVGGRRVAVVGVAAANGDKRLAFIRGKAVGIVDHASRDGVVAFAEVNGARAGECAEHSGT